MPYLLITAAVFWIDFFVKNHMDKKYACKVVHSRFRDKIRVEKYYNKGAALNFLAKRPKLMRSLHTAILAVVAVMYYLLLKMQGKPLSKMGTSLLLGGGLSNLYDRYARGHVVDYFHINIGPAWFRNIIFNLSDFCVFIGAAAAAAGSEQP